MSVYFETLPETVIQSTPMADFSFLLLNGQKTLEVSSRRLDK